MSGDACMVYDPALTQYNFGPSHPLNPIRVDLTVRLAQALGVVGEAGLPIVDAPTADEDLLGTVHTVDYIAAVRKITSADDRDLAHGLGTDDNPTFADMHRASAHVVGASVEAARQMWSGDVVHATNITGGLHHAMPDRASGFCVYNDVAVAIQWLLDNGVGRIAYVDVDVHHGDGVQTVFYDDPRVLTISLHESPETLFPGTGTAAESGGPDAPGSAVNVALPPGTSDAGWLRAFHAVVPPLVRAYAPDVLVTQHGCDSHSDDPLAHLLLSVDGQRASYLALHDLAHELCDGRWLATGGGGYALVDVVPRAWTHLLATVGGPPLDPDTRIPDSWQHQVESLIGRRGPESMGDGQSVDYRDWAGGYDPGAALDRSIMATRNRIFPLHGLDPMP